MNYPYYLEHSTIPSICFSKRTNEIISNERPEITTLKELREVILKENETFFFKLKGCDFKMYIEICDVLYIPSMLSEAKFSQREKPNTNIIMN